MEPARAGWSFNKWRKTRIPKQPRPNNRRQQNVHAPEAALVVGAGPEDAAVAAVVDVAALAAVEPVVDAALADRVAVADRAAAARVAKVVSAAADAESARVATAKADAVTVAASSSRT